MIRVYKIIQISAHIEMLIKFLIHFFNKYRVTFSGTTHFNLNSISAAEIEAKVILADSWFIVLHCFCQITRYGG
jgi:hypothetical protein